MVKNGKEKSKIVSLIRELEALMKLDLDKHAEMVIYLLVIDLQLAILKVWQSDK